MPPEIRAELGFNSIRVYFGDLLHIDVRRSTFRSLQTYLWPNYYAIEFVQAGGNMLVEYETEERWKAVLIALEKLKLHGE